jgi:hypothetical protein
MKPKKSINNTIKKTGLLAAGLFALTLNTAAQDDAHRSPLYIGNDNFGIKPVFQATAGANISRPFKEIRGIPEEYRLVPIHPEDTYASEYDNGPIHDTIKGPYAFDVAGVKTGVAIKLGKLEIEADISTNFSVPFNYEYLNERNYTNDPGTSTKGYGAALTYYIIKYSLLNFGTDLELSYPLNFRDDDAFMSNRRRIIVGVNQKKFNMNLEDGWDRWNALERNGKVTLAHVIETSWYAGILCQLPLNKTDHLTARAVVGYNSCELNMSQLKYQSIEPTKSGGIFAEASIGYRF